jgi:hypothetical protein
MFADAMMQLTFPGDFQVIILCPNITRTNASLAMRPILLGLAVTCWSVFHPRSGSANPRSPRQGTYRSSAFLALVSTSSSPARAGLLHEDVDTATSAFIIRVGALAWCRKTAAAPLGNPPGPRLGQSHCPAAHG